jgi:hypothetical protein
VNITITIDGLEGDPQINNAWMTIAKNPDECLSLISKSRKSSLEDAGYLAWVQVTSSTILEATKKQFSIDIESLEP